MLTPATYDIYNKPQIKSYIWSGSASGGDSVKIRIPMKIRDPAGPVYPPKSLSDAMSWEKWVKRLELSTAISAGDILGIVIALETIFPAWMGDLWKATAQTTKSRQITREYFFNMMCSLSATVCAWDMSKNYFCPWKGVKNEECKHTRWTHHRIT